MSLLAKSFDLIRNLENPIDKKERYKYQMTDLKKGAMLVYNSRTFFVEDVFTYEERNKQGKCKHAWFELKLYCLEDGVTSYMEYEEDDEIEIYFCQNKLKLGDIGMRIEEIEAMADEESGEIDYEGESYLYDDDYRAYFLKTGAPEAECYFYDFETKAGKSLSIEAWVNDGEWEYKLYTSISVATHKVEILSVGA
jgi:hypothetical protein